MKPTRAFNSLLILLIPLTFTWKLVAGHEALHEANADIAQFLMKHDFHVSMQTPMDGVTIVRATRPNCSMIIAEDTADGTMRYVVRELAGTMDQRFVIFRGQIYNDGSPWLTTTELWWAGYLRKLGISRFQGVPILVAANSSCSAGRLPWLELSDER